MKSTGLSQQIVSAFSSAYHSFFDDPGSVPTESIDIYYVVFIAFAARTVSIRLVQIPCCIYWGFGASDRIQG
jgi:hypothetical protein